MKRSSVHNYLLVLRLPQSPSHHYTCNTMCYPMKVRETRPDATYVRARLRKTRPYNETRLGEKGLNVLRFLERIIMCCPPWKAPPRLKKPKVRFELD